MRKIISSLAVLGALAITGCGEYADQVPLPEGQPDEYRYVIIADEDGAPDEKQVATACVAAGLPTGYGPVDVHWYAHDSDATTNAAIVTCRKAPR